MASEAASAGKIHIAHSPELGASKEESCEKSLSGDILHRLELYLKKIAMQIMSPAFAGSICVIGRLPTASAVGY